ncbi:MAG TPA: type II secretion system protein N [Usitatibacter sp.]|nr:type II secretion system protein N [Usitatibacter sp.]
MATLPASDAPRRSLAGDVLVAVLVVALAAQLAYWTWVFLAPPRTAAVPAPAGEIDLAAIARLFGASPPAGSTVAPSSSLRLKGVVAPTPGVAASAIFSTGSGRDLSVFLGRDVQPGVTLAQVHPDHVILRRNGIDERLDLEAPRSSAATAANPRAGATGFRVNVVRSGANSYTFSRRELDDALRDPRQLNHLGMLGMPPGGGVRMEQAPPGSLASKLGLQPGDIIKRVNGQDVASQGDLARVYTQFNMLSQVHAEVQRGSSTVHLSYTIQP